ncbi:kinase-like domain-containing protein [Rhizophagus irregularis DAOM 181602=DAOM 197198]|nr:kinase-like domain-containing protein [Rhizophagus irregularis DAOM 181602=DAOM 197198]POG82143.1 kinase-like domain-containing protein [Rhizophagus irregularis DAOM 181602=DAOM 197198]|eukprot:XP_025189009.1 kinase-like domain-containing protein [Rhizophagus irregularis DAOM 181602=DAOM 197198]
MGLCILANYNASEITKEKVYGVLSYIAPEILRGHNYTEASDIYSFGIIMYEMISGLPPYHDLSHDNNLAIKICQGYRPKFNIKVPQLIVHLIKRCLDANPLNRPTATEIKKILMQWWVGFNNQTELQDQIREADEINKKLSTNRIPSTSLELSYKTHSEAIYTSRLLDFENLPEPKNSDDYYEHYDNIVSMEYLESQQIDISQLKFNKDEILNNEFKGGDNI